MPGGLVRSDVGAAVVEPASAINENLEMNTRLSFTRRSACLAENAHADHCGSVLSFRCLRLWLLVVIFMVAVCR